VAIPKESQQPIQGALESRQYMIHECFFAGIIYDQKI